MTKKKEAAEDSALISIAIETPATHYEILFGYSSAQIETFVGEKLSSKTLEKVLIDRKVGSDKAILNIASSVTSPQNFQEIKPSGKLIEPEKPSLTRYIDLLKTPEKREPKNKIMLFSMLSHFGTLVLFKSQCTTTITAQQTNFSSRTKIMNLTFYISGLLSFFKDRRIIENIEQMIQKIMEKKTIRLFTVAEDKKEYNRYKSLLDGSLKSVLDNEKISKALRDNSVET